jgi:hypothetical protein
MAKGSFVGLAVAMMRVFAAVLSLRSPRHAT